MSRVRVFVGIAVGMILAVASAAVLVPLLPLGSEDASEREDMAAEPASSGFDVWALVDEDWWGLDDGAFCVDPGDATGCTDLSAMTHARPWLHFEAHPQAGQQVDLVYAKATGEGLSSSDRMVVAELPYNLFTEAGAASVSLYPHGPTSYRKLAARGTCQIPCIDTDGYEIYAGPMSQWSNQALHNEMRPPDDGHVPAEVYFPTQAFGGGPEAGAYNSTLMEHQGCLFMGEPPHPSLLLWPPGYRAVVIEGRTTVLDPLEEVAAVVGGPIAVVGGNMLSEGDVGPSESDWEHFEKLSGEPVPPRCRDASSATFWITELDNPDDPSAR